MRNLIRKEQGFTLIELLIVLAILGILVGIVAMSVGDLNDTAKTRGVQSELEIVQTAIDTYNTQDVTVDGAPTIVPGSAITITGGAGATDFGKYLKRSTKYTFSWDAGGGNLTSPDLP